MLPNLPVQRTASSRCSLAAADRGRWADEGESDEGTQLAEIVSSGRRLALVAVVLVALAAGLALPRVPASDGGPISRRGTYEGGRHLIEVPAGWNGGLVLYAHGYDGGTFDSPRSSHLLDRRYALAASSYRTEGYRVDLFVDDMRALLDLFIREVRRPRWAVIHGQSMGGHVAIVSLELHPGLSQGALIECGVIDGIGGADFYVAARAAAEYLGGVNLFEAPDRETLIRRVNRQWLPRMGAPPAYTVRGRRFDSVLKYLMGGDLPLRLQGLPPYYFRYVTPPLGPDTRDVRRAGEHIAGQIPDRPRPRRRRGRTQRQGPSHRAGRGREVAKREPGFRRTDRPHNRARARHPQYRGWARAV
jgi:hypothetical protein